MKLCCFKHDNVTVLMLSKSKIVSTNNNEESVSVSVPRTNKHYNYKLE